MRENTDHTIRIGKVAETGQPCEEISPDPCALVIFGASGDLTRKKLMPALFFLFKNKLLSKNFFILGLARTVMDDLSFRADMEKAVKKAGNYDPAVWSEFAERLFYITTGYEKEGFAAAKKLVEEKGKEYATRGNRIFYLATPPSAYEDILEAAASSGLASDSEGWTRVVIEKPYGRDLESARKLEAAVSRRFREEQVFRIDHYLGKDTVQNIMMFRFANSIFEPIWSRHFIDHVQITVSETIGIEKRAAFYEEAGVLRDIFQNHMLQVLSFIAMEPPSVYESELVRNERVKVLRALRPLEDLKEDLVLGQYVEGEFDGRHARGYTEEEGVARDSAVPTFAAMRAYIDNWRWQGVPFYLRSGKRLKSRFTQITIQFKKVPHLMFGNVLSEEIGPNALIMRIQPDERIQLSFNAKNPGSRVCLRDVVMDFPYLAGYEGLVLDAYERVLMDCMTGDKMLFVRSDGMELSWKWLAPALEYSERADPGRPDLYLYRAGSHGPIEAERFMAQDGRSWVNYDK
ncbi:MAG TPA: glucose-6-phosphate dehydrogenase [Deltaproteobacteria bacterium]|nr:MAG: glucose-6-phosphate dehydrogenase [Deltaproteobacteria bacterium GWA2_55_82]OGQ62317.1 MAG: glucose-6-phosphate dehydrogenase [Deltaproteobacteria bacterium RIFCSPLOWO2_02_FULL_55_12]OIJ74429.1 MAG: glucose-6-phosphate dehydrogenase [Deltaproteobacteria bacterium GWC2_55_46]HBG47082.1 glucose-6-phosphate dehydrogenase [Deltaproteobacteria bacterium]HCY10859.1 glucose-6-phosphate dehydrogenase [Deltaproteobacteria bacterium]